MRQFARLMHGLWGSESRTEQVALVRSWFRDASAGSAAWVVFLLTGRSIRTSVSQSDLKRWALEYSGLPEWLLGECHNASGDLAETLGNFVGDSEEPNHSELNAASGISLEELLGSVLKTLPALSSEARKRVVFEHWRLLDARQRVVFNKLLLGGIATGVELQTVVRALCETFGISEALVQWRLFHGRDHSPTAVRFKELVSVSETDSSVKSVLPVVLPGIRISKSNWTPTSDGSVADWWAELFWNEGRVQIVRHGEHCALWTESGRLLNAEHPELVEMAGRLEPGLVLEGQIQRVEPSDPAPAKDCRGAIRLWLSDVLEFQGKSTLEKSFRERRELLEKILGRTDWIGDGDPPGGDQIQGELFEFETSDRGNRSASESRPGIIRLSERLELFGADQLQPAFQIADCRRFGADGVRWIRMDSAEGNEGWVLQRPEPIVFGAALAGWKAADMQGGRGEFAISVRSGSDLVSVGMAEDGLSLEEGMHVAAFVKAHTTRRFGPMRLVGRGLVLEVSCESVGSAGRRASGIRLNGARAGRILHGVSEDAVTTLEQLKEIMEGAR